MPNKSPSLLLLSDENHERVLADLLVFFGPRSQPYIKIFEEMRIKQREWAGQTWSWPTLLLSFVWFFYRKMYLIGAIAILVPVVATLLFPGIGSIGAYAGFAIVAKPIYVQMGLRRILKADALSLTGAERADYLKRAGGVSWPAGVVAGVLYALFAAAAIYGAVNKAHAG